MSRLDRVSNTKAANIVIVVGLVLFGATIAIGLLYVLPMSKDGNPSLLERLRFFFALVLNSLPLWALVVAAGFALRVLAERTPAVATPTVTVTPPVPVGDMPAQSPITTELMQAPADDRVWRR